MWLLSHIYFKEKKICLEISYSYVPQQFSWVFVSLPFTATGLDWHLDDQYLNVYFNYLIENISYESPKD